MPMFGYEFSTASILDGRKKVDSASDSGCGKHPDYVSVIAYTAETIIPTLDLNEKITAILFRQIPGNPDYSNYWPHYLVSSLLL
jgi:hypothetical protein